MEQFYSANRVNAASFHTVQRNVTMPDCQISNSVWSAGSHEVANQNRSAFAQKFSTGISVAGLLLVMATSVFSNEPGGVTDQPVILFEDDFSELKPGQFSTIVGAHTEYHYLQDAAPDGPWSVTSFRSDISSQLAWKVFQVNEKAVLAQTFDNRKTRHAHPMVIAGNEAWKNYTLRVKWAPQSTRAQSGIVFRYHNDRCYYWFGVRDSEVVLKLVRHATDFRKPFEHVLASAPFSFEPGTTLAGRVTVHGDQIQAELIGGPALDAEDDSYEQGQIGLMADVPTNYFDCHVVCTVAEQQRVQIAIKDQQSQEATLQAANPGFRVWKKIKTEGFGVGRNIRFGDLNDDGPIDVLIGQVQHHGPKDRNSELSCLTAMTLDGEMLWQVGDPDPWKDHLTNDVAFQIHDLDGDGTQEVIYCKDMKIVVANGATGKTKASVLTPEMPSTTKPPYNRFPRILGDALYFCDLRGTGRAEDLILKDRYRHLWALDNNLNILWSAECNTGHYPFAYDVDKDGRDELAVGYSLYDDDGTVLWSLDKQVKDHADGVAIVRFGSREDDEPRVLCAASDSGMFFSDIRGQIIKHHFVGHVQNPAVADFRPDLPGLESVSINYWGNQGIIHLYDSSGDIYHDLEPCQHGSMCLPINWTGRPGEFFVLSANVEEGGMFDGWGRRVVLFPNDGHPDMCNAVLDITGDCRDEVVVWDPNELWVYTQSDEPDPDSLYKPVRNPLYNYSNYQTTVSLPLRAAIRPLQKQVRVGEPVEFSGGSSMGCPVEWTWTFDDGNEAMGDAVEHAFTEPGIHEVRLSGSYGRWSDDCTAIIRVHDDDTTLVPQVLLDTDQKNDQDDQCFLSYSLFSELDILGVNSVHHGGGQEEINHKEILHVIDLAKQSGLPETRLPDVFRGANERLSVPDSEEWSDTIPIDTPAARAILAAARGASPGHPVWVVPVGPGTNVASAILLAREEGFDLKDRIRVVWLGGTQNAITGEFNGDNDPWSVYVIAKSGVDLWIMPAPVGARVEVDKRSEAGRYADNPLGQYLRKITPAKDKPLYAPATISAIIGMRLQASWVQELEYVKQNGLAEGYSWEHTDTPTSVKVIREIDHEAMKRDLFETLKGNAQHLQQAALKQDPEYRPPVPPTFKDVYYGRHNRNLMDVWLAESDEPTPGLISIHGGAFRHGVRKVSNVLLRDCLADGISVVAITYRFAPAHLAPAQFEDAARAVQFIRHNAEEWNLDPSRIASTGGSAGAGLSLWLGLHDDMADPDSSDLVSRQSTRLTCMAVDQGQSSYDLRFIRELIPEQDTWKCGPLERLFGVDADELDALPEEKYALMEEVSALPHLSPDDNSPVLLTYVSALDTPVSDRSIGIHHARFGYALKDAMEQLGLFCEVHAGIPKGNPQRSKLMSAFIRKHLLHDSPKASNSVR